MTSEPDSAEADSSLETGQVHQEGKADLKVGHYTNFAPLRMGTRSY
jgi:hypothetical protein